MTLISQDLLAFIHASIRSVWALEVLLLLKREDRPWAVETIVQELRASTSLVAECLSALETAGLMRRTEDGGYLYAPASSALAELVDQLDQTYRKMPVTVVRAVLSSPNDKLQSFADAFRLKGDPK